MSTLAATPCQAVARTITTLRANHDDDQAIGAWKALLAAEMASGLNYNDARTEIDRLEAEARRDLAVTTA